MDTLTATVEISFERLAVTEAQIVEPRTFLALLGARVESRL